MLQQSHLLRNQPQSRKRRLFRFFHTILEHYSFHINIYYLLLVIEILQIANYGMHASFGPLWNTPFSNGIRSALSYTDLSALWQKTSPIVLIVFNIIFIVINAIALGFTIYQVQKDPKNLQKPNIMAIRFVSLYAIFLKSIFLIPLSLSFTAFINPDAFNLTTQYQISLAILSIIGFALTFVNLILYIFFLRDNSPFSKLPFSCSVNNQQELRSVFKLFLGVYGSMAAQNTKQNTLGIIFCIIYLLALFSLIYYSYTRAGYVQQNVGRLLQLGYVMGFWLGICSYINIQIKQQDVLGFVLCILGLILLTFAWKSIQNKKIVQLLTANYKSLHSSSKCLLYNYQCIRHANNLQDLESLQYLQGILNFHLMYCKKSLQLCVCTNVRTAMIQRRIDRQRQELQQQRKLWFQFIRTNLSEVRQKYDGVTEIRFLLAYIQNDVLANKFRSLHNLEQAREINAGYKYQFLDYHYLRQVQAKMEFQDKMNNQKKLVDINRYYNFQIIFGKLQESMEESTYQYVAFWELLKSDKVTKKKLYEQGVKINKKLDEIRQCFQKLNRINSSNIHALVLYSNFMKVIVNTNEPYQKNQETIQAVKRTMAQSMKLHRQVEKQKYGDNSISAVIIISGQRSNIGIIKHCNWKIGQIIGYAPHQLLGQNINVLMPKFIGNMHDDVLRNYLQLSQSQYDYVQRLVPMIDSRNFMVLARILTKPLPSLFNGLQLVGIFNAVTQNNINHPGEAPKYVLYRSDTGQVQALSQTCFNQFQYKINKIDEFNETSSQLTFNTLFAGARETDIIESQGFRCKIFAKNPNTSDVEEVPVEVFQRLQIYYYSVKLRLLSFYTLRSYRQMDDTINADMQVQPDKIMAHENQWEKQPKTQRSANQQKALKEKFLHEMSKKKGLVDNEPTAFKVLKACGYVFFLLTFAYSIILIILHTRVSTINDYLSLIQLSGQTIGDLCETTYYARMMHLSYFYPYLGNYSQFQNNISISVNSLQNGQFSIEKIYMNYGSTYKLINQWSISNNGKVSSSTTTIDADIFNLVTAASSFNQNSQSRLNFPLVLMNGANNVTSALQQIFQIRYSSLFETIPKKQDYGNHFSQLFKAFIDQRISYGIIEISCAIVFLVIFFSIILPLSLSLLTKIDQTILLFGFMSRHQVDRQIDNCNSFLDIFYQDSYLIWLKKKQKMKEQIMVNPLIADEMQLKMSQKGGGTINAISGNLSQAQFALKQTPSHQSLVKASLNKIQFLQKQLHLRTEAEIMISQNQQQNQNQLLRGQVDSSEEDGIHQHLSQDKDKSKLIQIIIYILLILFFSAYFITEFLLFKKNQFYLKQEMAHVQLAYTNINALKLVRLYSLEALIDNSVFQNYSRPSQIANASYINLYMAQREFDQVALNDQSENTIYYTNLCEERTVSQLKGIVKLFPSSSYSSTQCKKILSGVLIQGLRLSIVGYTETLYNLTKLTNISQVMNGTAFLQARQIQKYIEAPLRIFASRYINLLYEIIDNSVQSLVLLLVGFFFVLAVLWVCLWSRNLHSLRERLRSTRIILGFIPVRVFVRNTKLTREYEKYIGQLMQ